MSWDRATADHCEDVLAGMLGRIEHPVLREASLHYPRAGGKRIRPRLVVMIHDALGGERPEVALVAGTALEAIHTFTLVHDDVMDEDEVRRGRPAVHVRYDIPTAINAGDAMFACAVEELAETLRGDPNGPAVIAALARAVRLVTEGQQYDIHPAPGHDPVAAYLEMVRLKTGALFRTAAEMGALIAGVDDDKVQSLAMAGEKAGIGFQIQDDLLDLAPQEETGKEAYRDLRKGKRTLPVILAEEGMPAAKRAAFRSRLEAERKNAAEIEALREELEESGAVVKGHDMANGYIGEAEAAFKEGGAWDSGVAGIFAALAGRRG